MLPKSLQNPPKSVQNQVKIESQSEYVRLHGIWSLSCTFLAAFWSPFGTLLESIFKQKSEKCHPENHGKNDHQKTRNFTPKGCQNDPEIYAKTHQTSMQKQIAKKIRNIMKKHVFPTCRTMPKHYTVVKKRGLAR